MRTDFLLWVFYTEKRKKKNNMENFLNQIQDLSQEVPPQREKKHEMSQMKILYDLPQGELPQRGERLR
jgi:hypothetical protein